MTRLMFMDERFAHPKDAKASQVTALTALIVDADHHRAFCDRFYALLRRVIQSEDNVVPAMPEIHGHTLLPACDDETRSLFLTGLIEIATELEYSIFRIGYRENRHFVSVGKSERDVLGLCFLSLRFCIESKCDDRAIWPVMEIDRNYAEQDLHFPGQIQSVEWSSKFLDSSFLSVDPARFGEALYHGKRSAYGAMVDCFSYLLHIAHRATTGEDLSSYKRDLARLCEGLAPIVRRNEVIDLQIGTPPPNHVSDGPIRWVFPITPQD